MTRAHLAVGATAALVLLTLATGLLYDRAAPAWTLAAAACVKAAVVGWVFLELDRAWWVWGAMLALGTAGVAFGAVAVMGG